MRRPSGVIALGLLLLPLAGCADQEPIVVPGEPVVDPQGEPFADTRHCHAYNLVTAVARTDLMPLVPPDWSFANPLAPTVRVLVVRCPDQAVALLTVPMRAGDAGDATAPEVEYLLQAFREGADRGGTADDWGRLGAPVAAATMAVEGSPPAIAIEAEGGWAVRAALSGSGDPGRQYEHATLYGAGRPVVQSWAEESAILATPLQLSSMAFGPGSALRDAHVVPLHSGTWWGAYNAWYREGWPA